ncbi:MAG: hypothetical protein A2534_01095 [Candidatus Magasanikbacteria bacterium RIFOXYD2_FULL_39_9]|uniref:Uncharacterized protein n=1 Tax=Candidatus Magasanikbacteria bacterium RIFOXYD1_FULL_40_23 TaxID=1798705 RepID=A0A1F6PAT6_9BACT|nr:MAG: hypothetical protein A2534_01095 [Candidatus Magasanikbacteria bacterium RIFOXYD2_FULL_39_9]OGH93272.1 MAG: hypothetical protein A2563_01555 [Candidatus Magasanikbacteria bacterium RIFOXYD1_FULL_40_23]
MKKFLLVLGWLVSSILFAVFFGRLYYYLGFSKGGGLFLSSNFFDDFINGLFPSYIFFLTLLFTAFGGTKKYWWIGIALIPAVLFEVAFDLQHIYFPVAVGLVGWLLGKGVNMLVEKHKL